MGAKKQDQCYTTVCVGCRWGDAFRWPVGEELSPLDEARRRHEVARNKVGCILNAYQTVYIVDGITDPTVEKVGRALMQPFITMGKESAALMIANAFGISLGPLTPNPTVALAVAQGLVPDPNGSTEVDGEELELVGSGV